MLRENMLKYVDAFMVAFDENHVDARTANRFLVQSFWPVLAICTIYVFLVRFVVPKIMEHRDPIDVRIPIIVVNSFQVLTCLYVTVGLGHLCWWTFRYSWCK